MHRGAVSLKAFLGAMAVAMFALAASAAAVRPDATFGPALAGAMFAVWGLSLVIAAAVSEGRARTIAVAALAASVVHWHLGRIALAATDPPEFVTIAALEWRWAQAAETPAVDYYQSLLAEHRFLRIGLLLVSVWLGAAAGFVAWLFAPRDDEAVPVPRRVSWPSRKSLAIGAGATLALVAVPFAANWIEPPTLVPLGYALVFAWCAALLVAIAGSPRWRTPAAAALAATWLHLQLTGFGATNGASDFPSTLLADALWRRLEPAALPMPPAIDDPLLYRYVADERLNSFHSLATGLASIWLGAACGAFVAWRLAPAASSDDFPANESRSGAGPRSLAKMLLLALGVAVALGLGIAVSVLALALDSRSEMSLTWIALGLWLWGTALAACSRRPERRAFGLAALLASWATLEIERHYAMTMSLPMLREIHEFWRPSLLQPLHDWLSRSSAPIGGGAMSYRLAAALLSVWLGLIAGAAAIFVRSCTPARPASFAPRSDKRLWIALLVLFWLAMIGATDWALMLAETAEAQFVLSVLSLFAIVGLAAGAGGSAGVRVFGLVSLVAWTLAFDLSVASFAHRAPFAAPVPPLLDFLQHAGWRNFGLISAIAGVSDFVSPEPHVFVVFATHLLALWLGLIVGTVACLGVQLRRTETPQRNDASATGHAAPKMVG